jgi:predicted NUDIX family NTP pyrophosphohydrolase
LKESAGTLLYRQAAGGLEVLLVHPSGSYNRRAAWSIPKGEPLPGESMELAARRETVEETGVRARELFSLGFADYKRTRKRIYCFAGKAKAADSPRCASWEVDRAEFMPLSQARALLHQDQAVFIERLEVRLLAAR